MRNPAALLTDEILKAIRAVIDYNWVDEEADFSEHEDDGEFHIFTSLQTLESFLTDCTLATGSAEPTATPTPRITQFTAREAPPEPLYYTIYHLVSIEQVDCAGTFTWEQMAAENSD